MNETLASLSRLFERDLSKLKEELMAYEEESRLWEVKGDIINSGGTLCLHLCGNLKHFIGAVLGNSGYVRERDREFNDRNVPRADMAKNIDETLAVVTQTLESFDPEKLNDEFPLRVFQGKPMSNQFFLMHLSSHLTYHLGQVNYHRRILEA